MYKTSLSHWKDRLFQCVCSFISSFVGIALVSYLSFRYTRYPIITTSNTSFPPLYTPSTTPPFLIASFGATAVLIYGEINSPLAQPKNTIGGQIISATVGVTVHQVFDYAHSPTSLLWLQAALAVSLAITSMQLTGTVHPPGGATALIAIIGGEHIFELGYWFVVMPVLVGTLILLSVSILLNLLMRRRGFGESITSLYKNNRDTNPIIHESESVIIVTTS